MSRSRHRKARFYYRKDAKDDRRFYLKHYRNQVKQAMLQSRWSDIPRWVRSSGRLTW